MKNYKIIKLKSGEDVIGTVRIGKDDSVKIFKPMVFKSMVQSDIFGGMKEYFMLKNWLMLSDDNFAVIKKDAINTIVNASADVSALYETEKEKENYKKTTKPKAKKPELQGETGPDAGLNPFDIIDKHIKELLEKSDKMYEQESNVKDLAKQKPDDKMIFMNMVFAPDVLIEMLKSGILDRKEFGEMVNEITNTNGEGMNPQKYTGNKKDKKDFGNIWTDWHPDPSSEEYK